MNTTLFHKVMRGVLLLSWLTCSGVAHAADVLTSPDGRLRVTVGVKLSLIHISEPTRPY